MEFSVGEEVVVRDEGSMHDGKVGTIGSTFDDPVEGTIYIVKYHSGNSGMFPVSKLDKVSKLPKSMEMFSDNNEDDTYITVNKLIGLYKESSHTAQDALTLRNRVAEYLKGQNARTLKISDEEHAEFLEVLNKFEHSTNSVRDTFVKDLIRVFEKEER